jgi:2-hydroxy-6-oxonona-2,4-dienedioate hydrolase
MTQIKTDFLNLDGGKLYYEIAGAGETLMLNHAGFVDSRMWDDQWQAFAQQYRVIRYDMRGYGKSDVLQAPVTRRDDLLLLLDHLQVERAHLLGCSMGGEIVIDFALEHPERVLSLIPISAVPSGFEMQGAPPALLLDMIAAAQAGDVERTSELQLRIWIDGEFRQPEEVDASVRQRAAAMNRIFVQNGTFAMDMQAQNPLTPPAAGRLQALTMPTLVIVGALDNPEILRAADVMVEQMPNAQKLILPDSAHTPSMEKPAEFNQAVLNFLSERG